MSLHRILNVECLNIYKPWVSTANNNFLRFDMDEQKKLKKLAEHDSFGDHCIHIPFHFIGHYIPYWLEWPQHPHNMMASSKTLDVTSIKNNVIIWYFCNVDISLPFYIASQHLLGLLHKLYMPKSPQELYFLMGDTCVILKNRELKLQALPFLQPLLPEWNWHMFTSTIHDVQTNTLMIYAPTTTIKTIHALVIILLSHPNTRHYMLVYAASIAIHALINTLLSHPTTGHYMLVYMGNIATNT